MPTTFSFRLNFHLDFASHSITDNCWNSIFLQYYRLVTQHAATAPAVPPFFGYPGNGGPGLCLSQPGIMVSNEMYMASDVDSFAGGGFQISVPLSNYFFSKILLEMFADLIQIY